MTSARPGTVSLALSSYRNDESVERLLRDTLTARARARFARVIVVDSLGTGVIPALLEREGWDHVVYESASTNLGSAGNFARRLALAAELGDDYVFALNHDGTLDLDMIDRLVAFADATPGLGAAYPLRYLTQRAGFEITGATRSASPVRAINTRPVAPAVPVHWSSSNASLYALAPVRKGLLPWADLWMGWEDLGYGWALERAGYVQFVVSDARFDDGYEYRQRRVLGIPIHLTDKPSWYAYYQIRNLILIARRAGRSPLDYMTVGGRLAQELALTTLFRSQKRERLRLLAEGVADGMRNRAGKGRVP